MHIKQYLTLGIGIVAGLGLSVVGVSYASQNLNNNVKLVTPEVAKTIMLNKVPGANFIEFSYDGDDKNPKYDGTLIKDNYEYEVDVNAKTGKIIKFEKEAVFVANNANKNNASTDSTQATSQPNNTTQQAEAQQSTTQQNATKQQTTTATPKKSYIGEAKAKLIMLNKVPGASVKSFHFDGDSTPEYDGELIKDGYEYDISVDAYTGAIKEFSKERIYTNTTSNNATANKNTNTNTSNTNTNNTTNTNKVNTATTASKTYIGQAKAKSIMLSKVPGATIRSFHFDGDSTPEYEAELIKNGYEYDISVNAYTGAIIEFSKDRIDTYDDDRYDDDRYDDDDDDRYDD